MVVPQPPVGSNHAHDGGWLGLQDRSRADAGNPSVEYQPSMMGRRLKPRFTLEVQRSGQGLCPTLLRLPGLLAIHCRALASHASQPVATGVATRKRAGMRIDPADLAESIGTLAD